MYHEYEEDDIPVELDITPNVYANVIEEEYDQETIIENLNIAAAALPDEIKKFIFSFHSNLAENNVYELQYIYEVQFNKLTERYFQKTLWPEPEVVSHLVNDDQIFLILYRELYYRHIYSKLHTTIEYRFQSYENYCDLFNYILNSGSPVPLELPNQWLWDIIDEFIYQFQSFCTYRSKTKNKSEEELELLKLNPHIWSCYSVLNVLYSLIQKSNINKQLKADNAGQDSSEIAGEYGTRQLYKMLGLFSIVGLLRVHCLLGNYTMGLKMLDNVDLSKKSLFTRVTACHITLYYYIGFCYLMMCRFSDAIRILTNILVFVTRTKGYYTKSYQFEQTNKKVDQMYALLAICSTLFTTRLDENLHSTLREKFGEQITRMRSVEGSLDAYKELFNYASPRFISPTSASTDSNEANVSPSQQQLENFMSSVRHQALIPTLRSYLSLYTSLSIPKLAHFLNLELDEVRRQLMILKLKSHQKKQSTSTNLLHGSYENVSDLEFVVNGDLIQVTEQKVARRYGDYYIRTILKLDDIVHNLNHRG